MGGAVGACTGQHLAAALDIVHRMANEVQLFGVCHGCRFSCGAANHQGGHTGLQLPVQQLVVDFHMDKIQPEGRN